MDDRDDDERTLSTLRKIRIFFADQIRSAEKGYEGYDVRDLGELRDLYERAQKSIAHMERLLAKLPQPDLPHGRSPLRSPPADSDP